MTQGASVPQKPLNISARFGMRLNRCYVVQNVLPPGPLLASVLHLAEALEEPAADAAAHTVRPDKSWTLIQGDLTWWAWAPFAERGAESIPVAVTEVKE